MRICLVSSGLEERNQRLQPWRYLLDTADKLRQAGHDLDLLSDGSPLLPAQDSIANFPITRISKIGSQSGCENKKIIQTIASFQPDVVLWHLGLTSFLHLPPLTKIPAPTIGIFTSPIYQPRELLQLGVCRLLRGWRLSALHILGLFVPDFLLKGALRRGMIQHLVVECETTRNRLIQRGVPIEYVSVIRPQIDSIWFRTRPSSGKRMNMRNSLGFSTSDFIVGYFGPPTPLRGLSTLIQSVAMVRRKNKQINLMILSRQRDDESSADQHKIEKLKARLAAEQWIHSETSFLPRKELIEKIAACDIVALPFEIVPSDVPLSVLEAMALKVPLITTNIGCLQEMVPEGAGLRIRSGDKTSLAEAIYSLASNPKLSKKVAATGRARAMQWDSYLHDISLFSRLLKR